MKGQICIGGMSQPCLMTPQGNVKHISFPVLRAARPCFPWISYEILWKSMDFPVNAMFFCFSRPASLVPRDHWEKAAAGVDLQRWCGPRLGSRNSKLEAHSHLNGCSNSLDRNYWGELSHLRVGWAILVWNMNCIFPYIGNVIIPTDALHHFSEG